MYKTVDLFAGAGGLSFGFASTKRFRIVAAAENNKNARETYLANHKHKNDIVMIEDVRGYDFRKLSDMFNGIDVVIGGPPCQGFSNANRQKNHIISMNNSLVKEYFRAIKEMKPKAFVMENVSMLSSDTHRFYDSERDHDDVLRLGVDMRTDKLVIADENYDGVDCFTALNQNDFKTYAISNELFQLLNVLCKDGKSKENRLLKFVEKNAKIICKKIDEYLTDEHYDYEILSNIKDSICSNNLKDYFCELKGFLKFQKSFRLLEELKSNNIIFDLNQEQTSGKIVALVHSYSVIDYVNKILGEDYVTTSGVFNALWFGVPQERKRFIMIGIRSDEIEQDNITLPDGKGKKHPVVTVGKAIMDLAIYEASSEMGGNESIPYKKTEKKLSEYASLMRKGSKCIRNHVVPQNGQKALERFAALKEGDNFHKLMPELKDNYAEPGRTQNSIYLRLNREEPSGTVTNVRKSMWVHPTINRAISIREAARLQSFPDKFVFMGTKGSQYQQIGNAVPPLMAKGIAKLLLKYLRLRKK